MSNDEIGAVQDPLRLLGVSGDDDDVGDDDEIGALDFVGDDDDVSGEEVAGLDFVGDDDDVSGDDDDVSGDDDEIGAVRRVARKLRKSPRQLTRFVKKARVLGRKARASAKKRQAGRMRDKLGRAALAGKLPTLALPVDSVAVIAAAATQDVQPQPTRTLRITDFIVSPDIAASFRINRIEIAGVNLFAGGNSIDASCFLPTVQRPPLKTVLLPAGVPATVNVTNKSGAAAIFSAVLYGIPVHAM